MAIDPQLASLASQTVELLAKFFSAKYGPVDWNTSDWEAVEAVFSWLRKRSEARTREAVQDLEGDPASEDNKADLRKQLVKQLENSDVRDEFIRSLPEKFRQSNIDQVVRNVGVALNHASQVTGSFNTVKIH